MSQHQSVLRYVAWWAFGAAALSWSGVAPAGIHQVWDEAHAFKPATLERADRIIDEIHDRLGKDVLVETFASIPDDLKQAYQQQGKDRFFEGWANTEGHDLEINGIVILITQDPPHVQVAVGAETSRRAFPSNDRDELVRKLVAAFRQREFDNGLLEAAQFIRERLARNAAGERPSTRPTTRPATTKPIGSQPASSQPDDSQPAAPRTDDSQPAAPGAR